ncbi:hypothetical protein [Fischerella sp. JS2]|uniref:HD domain-containing protein n=1 Tax=Fischerella sp. JS2 TaxID=2597771 RepID=UPI0028ED828A|nr:hypothetical protein [Fischerella sp. JS2]
MVKINYDLFTKWWQLLQSFQVEQTVAEEAFSQLVAAYSAPGRYYHTLEHIYYVLSTIETLQNQVQDLPPVQLAVWFHDVVYNTLTQDNEQQSASYALEVLGSLQIPHSIIARVISLILNTKHDQAEPDDFDAQVFLDADLEILGSNPQRYHQYALLIRQEYLWMPDVEYLAGRKQVLRQFLHRDRIYLTDLMFNKFESSARQNLRAEIMRIEQISQANQL